MSEKPPIFVDFNPTEDSASNKKIENAIPDTNSQGINVPLNDTQKRPLSLIEKFYFGNQGPSDITKLNTEGYDPITKNSIEAEQKRVRESTENFEKEVEEKIKKVKQQLDDFRQLTSNEKIPLPLKLKLYKFTDFLTQKIFDVEQGIARYKKLNLNEFEKTLDILQEERDGYFIIINSVENALNRIIKKIEGTNFK